MGCFRGVVLSWEHGQRKDARGTERSGACGLLQGGRSGAGDPTRLVWHALHCFGSLQLCFTLPRKIQRHKRDTNTSCLVGPFASGLLPKGATLNSLIAAAKTKPRLFVLDHFTHLRPLLDAVNSQDAPGPKKRQQYAARAVLVLE